MNTEAFLKNLNCYKEQHVELSYLSDGGNHDLFYMFKEALGDSVDRNENAKILVDNLDIVLGITGNSFFWTEFKCIYEVPNFYDKLFQSIKYFENKNKLPALITSICSNSESKDIFENSDLIEYVLLNSDMSYMCGSFMNYMDDTEMKIDFLKLVLKTKTPIDFWFANFSDNHIDVKPFVMEHLDEFMAIVPNLFDLRKFIADDRYSVSRINEYLNNHHNQVLDSIFFVVDFGSNIDDVNNLKDLVGLFVDDIIKNENGSYSDIEFDGGCYSLVLFIKNKVLKIGTGRKTERFHNNPYMVKPLLRKKLILGDLDVFLEVTEIEKRRIVSRTELLKLYSDIRDLGLVWTDVKPNNVAELLKDNKIYWRFPLELSDETLGLDEYRGEGIELKKGDLVVIDADFIYDENDPIFYQDGNDLLSSLPLNVQDFEYDYQKVKKLKRK